MENNTCGSKYFYNLNKTNCASIVNTSGMILIILNNTIDVSRSLPNLICVIGDGSHQSEIKAVWGHVGHLELLRLWNLQYCDIWYWNRYFLKETREGEGTLNLHTTTDNEARYDSSELVIIVTLQTIWVSIIFLIYLPLKML